MKLGTAKLKKKEVWRVTVGNERKDFDQLNHAMADVTKAVTEMGWPDRTHDKVTIERVPG